VKLIALNQSFRLAYKVCALVCIVLVLIISPAYTQEVIDSESDVSSSREQQEASDLVTTPIKSDERGGYLGAKWGMSRAEVKAAFPEIKKKKWNRGSRAIKPNVMTGMKKSISHKTELYGTKVLRVFSFNENDELTEVIIHPLSAYISALGKYQLNDMLRLWPSMEDEILTNYGKPLFAIGNMSGGTSETVFEDFLYGGRYIQRRYVTSTTTVTLQIQRNSLISEIACFSVCQTCSMRCQHYDRFHPFLTFKGHNKTWLFEGREF